MSDVFDFNSVVQLLMGDEEVARELLKSYLSQTEEQMKLLNELLTDVDFEKKRDDVRRKSHLIKGSSLNVSAKQLGVTMLEMEKGANTLPLEDLLKLYEIAKSEFATLKEEISKVLIT